MQTGTELINTDDRQRWINSGTDWILQELPIFKKFKVFKDGATTFVTDNNSRIVQSNSDTQLAVQAEIDAMPSPPAVYEFVWDAGPFTLNNPIVFPSIPGATVKRVNMKGSAVSGYRATTGGTTCLIASTTFPTNRYMFELTNAGTSNSNGGMVEIDGFQATNVDNFPGGNFNGVNVGFCKLEAGARTGFDDYIVTNCFGNYIWRMLHLIGAIWSGRFENILTYSSNATFTYDAHVLLEDGGHVSSNEPTPKVNRIRNLQFYDALGQATDAIRFESAQYNQINNVFIGGRKYTNSVICLNNTEALPIHGNTLTDITVIDLATPTPDTRQAAVYLAGTACYGNTIRNLRIDTYPITVLISGTGVRHNDIELEAIWGNVASITDTGANASNTFRIKGGATTGNATAITHTGAISRIIDTRKGATGGGTATFSGDGTTTAFNIAHGIFKSPAWVIVGPGNDATMTASPMWWTWGATNITVTFETPPVSARSVSLRWRAEAYL